MFSFQAVCKAASVFVEPLQEEAHPAPAAECSCAGEAGQCSGSDGSLIRAPHSRLLQPAGLRRRGEGGHGQPGAVGAAQHDRSEQVIGKAILLPDQKKSRAKAYWGLKREKDIVSKVAFRLEDITADTV